MEIFFHLFSHILPLYGLIFLGFCAGRWLKVDRLSLANLAIFICMPAVMFGFIVKLDFKVSYLFLIFVYIVISTLLALIFLTVGKKVYKDHRANLLSLVVSQPNVGYFGLPVVLLVFDAHWVAVYMIIILSAVLSQATIGYYLAARGAFDVRGSLLKLARFPAVYVVPLGFIMNAQNVVLPDSFWTYWQYFKGAYVILGMMIIGCALSAMHHIRFSLKFNGLAFLGKFIFWPCFIGAFVFLDRQFFHWFAPEIHTMLVLLSLMPPGANITAFAAQFDIDPEKTATTVLVGTILSLLLIPMAVVLLGIH